MTVYEDRLAGINETEFRVLTSSSVEFGEWSYILVPSDEGKSSIVIS